MCGVYFRYYCFLFAFVALSSDFCLLLIYAQARLTADRGSAKFETIKERSDGAMGWFKQSVNDILNSKSFAVVFVVTSH